MTEQKPAGFTNPFSWLKKKANQKQERHEEQPQAAAPAPPPVQEAAPPPPPAAAEPQAPAATTVQERTYRVRAGDTLWDIAERFYGDGQQYHRIAAANNISNPDQIDVGWELKIPD